MPPTRIHQLSRAKKLAKKLTVVDFPVAFGDQVTLIVGELKKYKLGWPHKALEDCARMVIPLRHQRLKSLAVKNPTPPNKAASKKAQDLVKQAFAIWNNGLTSMPYPQFLTTKYWLLIRAARIEYAAHCCERCGRKVSLQVHHLDYSIRGNEHKNMSRLLALCDACHKGMHKL